MADPVLDDLRRHPQLNRALRQLRHKALLTQEQLAALVTGKGQKVSAVFLRKCEAETETTRRYPSEEMLTALLDALGSSPVELYLMLNELAAESSTASSDPNRYRITETTQRYATPESLPVLPAKTAFTDPLAAARASSTVSYAGAADSLTAPPSMLRSASRGALAKSAPATPEAMAVNAAFASSVLPEIDMKTEAIRAEIWNGIPELSSHDQNTLLGVYRSLRRGK